MPDAEKLSPFFEKWVLSKCPDSNFPHLVLLSERPMARDGVIPILTEAVKDHLVGLKILKRIGGYPKAHKTLENSVPTKKKIRSGDLGEILATEYIEQKMNFHVPVRRLRYKDDRDTAMRGDDVIGVRRATKKTQVLKAECKSRKSLGPSVVETAAKALMRHSARPNPSTLAFISKRLRELKRHSEAEVIESLQQNDVKDADLEHLVFTFSGNDPLGALSAHANPARATLKRHLVGLVVDDHQDFIKVIFEAVMK